MDSALTQRILQVVAYSNQFHFPLTLSEIVKRWFVVTDKDPLRRVGEQEVKLGLRDLVRQGKLAMDRGYYFFPEKNDLVAKRLQKEKSSKVKRQEMQPLLKFLQRWSWVAGVAVTGSLAMNSAGPQDDADFLVVTQPNRLWLTRLLVIFFAWKHGKRRSFANEEPNSWCFNLWLDSNNLCIPLSQHTLYTAYEACQADWVINRHQTAERFFQSNRWVSSVLPHFHTFRVEQLSQMHSEPLYNNTLWRILSPVLFLMDYIAYFAQRIYMMPHHTSERIGYGFAWFHPEK